MHLIKYSLSSIIFVKGFMSFVVFQVIRLEGSLFNSTESFAQFTNKVVFFQICRNMILSKQHVHLLHLLEGHPQGAGRPRRQLPLAQSTVAVEINLRMMFRTQRKSCLGTSFRDPLPIQTHLFTDFLFQSDQPMLGDGVGHRTVTCPCQTLFVPFFFDFVGL